MRSFYEAYSDNEKVHTLCAQINWSNHKLILARNSSEEREFYLRLTARERYSVRELERQIKSSFFERVMASEAKYTPSLKAAYPKVEQSFRDSYSLEFLGLPRVHSEKDLRKGIVKNLKHFIMEFGGDFTFMGEEYKVDVGMKKFSIDLLFFHRELKCLVAFELKVEEFKPSHTGQMSFYLAALDEQVKRSDENPSVGIILCREKNDDIVRLALGNTMSPTLVADYQTKLHVESLQHKFQEFILLTESTEE
jgi:predicted nuclease of restriction endonuclease-like (RecB) superfamily